MAGTVVAVWVTELLNSAVEALADTMSAPSTTRCWAAPRTSAAPPSC